MQTPACTGRVCLLGGHVTHWQPRGQEPVLWMSETAVFREGKAIRGGIPICFPWFGPKADAPDAPSHGTVRTKRWTLEETEVQGELAKVVLATETEGWRVRMEINFGPTLQTSLVAENLNDTLARYEDALHTYLTVSDAREVQIVGLEKASYLDKVDAGAEKPPSGQAIAFVGETDRVYMCTESTVTLNDPKLKRAIAVEKAGSKSTVVWNPWIDKAAALGDMPDDAWPGMCCIETANIGADAVEVEPGESHTTVSTLRVMAI